MRVEPLGKSLPPAFVYVAQLMTATEPACSIRNNLITYRNEVIFNDSYLQ